MHPLQVRCTRFFPLLLLVIGFLVLPIAQQTQSQDVQQAQQLQQLQQPATHYDTPLLTANMCGAGPPDDVHFSFAATGDVFPHINIQMVAESVGYDYLFDHVRPFLQASDIAYTNFDGAMLAHSPYTGYPAFNYNPALGMALKNAGIGVVSTANNHILDRGPEGIDATLSVFEEAGIMQHGTVPTTASAEPRPVYLPITLTRDGVSINIAFLSFTWGTNGLADPYNQVNLLWNATDYGQQSGIRQQVLDDIAQAKRETDFVIVAAHWGQEYQMYPNPTQIEGATRMAQAGADVILGAQPHTLQPVDILDTNGRKTLVIYSLANFLADQAVFQASSFSDTSVIFYVGIVRRSDGSVAVSGYRYLPIMMTENTRQMPIPSEGFENLHAHVRLKMRDLYGALQVGNDPATALGADAHIAVCPTYGFASLEHGISGDFAQYFTTLGSGTVPRALHESLAVVGYPIGPVVQELTGDCGDVTSVLYTERQRLEFHPENDWPYRVVGSHIGTAVYQKNYHTRDVPRRTDIEGDAIVNPRFKRFYDTYGGLTMFGYPISDELVEVDEATGQEKTVQYFERARFELVPGVPDDASPLEQVQLGLLGREYPGIVSQCWLWRQYNPLCMTPFVHCTP